MITKWMGFVLFLVGLALILLAFFGLFFFEQSSGLSVVLLMFIGGAVLCVPGYFMARDQPAN